MIELVGIREDSGFRRVDLPVKSCGRPPAKVLFVVRDSSAKNRGADYRGVTHVDIEKRPDASNGHGIGWTQAGEWVVYTVEVQESGTYAVEFPVASAKKGGTFHLEFNGKDVTGPIELPNTGSWQKLETIRKENVRLEAGTYVLKMVMDTEGETGSVGDIDFIRFVKIQ